MKSLGTPELQSMIYSDPHLTLINTLPPHKFVVTRIPGSKNVPLQDENFAENVEQCTGSKDCAVIVYAENSTSKESSQAAEQLDAAGFTDVYCYTGGVKAWQAAGGILSRPSMKVD